MKAYVLTTGALFALLVLLHLWRFTIEGTALLQQPFFIVATIVPAAMCAWAWLVFRRL
jgi:hypothetical protein